MPTKHKTSAPRAAKGKESKAPRITYATLAVTQKDDEAYDAAVAQVRVTLDKTYPMYINGQARQSTAGNFEHRSPVDTRFNVASFPKGTREDAKDAIRAARAAFPQWSALDYRDRIKFLRRAADLIVARRFESAAWMAVEVGKNRAEALAEINESAELIRYYCERMEFLKGYVLPLESPGPGQETLSVLRPYGVWAVIAPWNFPMALAMGMSAGALLAGNTVVFKPSSDAALTGLAIYRALADAGLPPGVFNFITGPGATVGAELQENRGVDGLVFTGSKEVGLRVYKNFAKEYPKPVIAEMGGKNPALVMASADLDQAAEGVMRAAFGFDGQKCSACSRVYVDNRVKEKFLTLLHDQTKRKVKVGDPIRKETFMGPVINKPAVETFVRAAEDARKSGGEFIFGGRVMETPEFAYGYFVEPTIVAGLSKEHRLFKEELFLPFLVVAGVDSFDEALKLANESEYGLCAGIYSRDKKEIESFFNHIHAGVTYSNRRAGATTGAWPGINSFGGWKGSGSSGKSALGPYYVQQFMREQSRWVVK